MQNIIYLHILLDCLTFYFHFSKLCFIRGDNHFIYTATVHKQSNHSEVFWTEGSQKSDYREAEEVQQRIHLYYHRLSLFSGRKFYCTF